MKQLVNNDNSVNKYKLQQSKQQDKPHIIGCMQVAGHLDVNCSEITSLLRWR